MTTTRSSLAGRRAVVVNWRDPWHSLAGGSERYAWEYAKALHAAGVTAYTPERARKSLAWCSRCVRALGDRDL